MALFRKLFYRKPPEGVLEISERIYVFDRCFTTDVWEEKNYKGYVAGVISQLKDHYPDVSILAFNFREGESQSRIANDLSEHYVTIMDYPRHYKGCPLVSMEMINHFLRSSESWLSLGQQNVLLMHCEWGGWPVLAFMLAALLIYRRHFTGEQKTLDMIYKQAPRELLYLLQPLNPIPSQLRYLQYVARRNANMQWPPMDRALTLDCIIIRMIPNFDGEGGCRPMFRIYGKGPLIVADQSPKNLFSTPKKNNVVRHYKQAECELVKIDINCHIQGDVVLECINLHDDREEMMFRTMFNTSFIKSNILILNRDEIDTLWDAKDQFPKDFRLEVLFLEMDAAASVVPVDLSSFDKKDGLPVEAFAKVQEILNSADWLNQNGDAPGNVLQLVETEGSSASSTSSPVSPHERTTVEHPSLHERECGKQKEVSALPEIKTGPLKMDVLTSPSSSPPPLPANDQVIVTVPSPSQPTVSQPDTSPLPLEIPSTPFENDKIAKMEPVLPTCPSGSSSPTIPISNIKHLEEKLINKSGMLPSSPPLPHSAPISEENSASVSTPQTPAPPTPPLKQNLTFSSGSSPSPPPPPPPPPPPAPTSSPCLLLTTAVLSKNCSSISGPPPPPPLKEKLDSKGGILPPPPPPPPLPGQPVKENSSLTGGPCPPPPPPLPSSQASKPTELYSVPPVPPPPPLVSSLKDNNNLPKSVPSVPPPPVSFPKVNNVPASPSPPPPIAPPPNKNYRQLLSSTMTSRSNSTKKLKPLHWLKISRAVQGTFWAEIEKCSYASKSSVIDMPELVHLFSVQNLDQVGSGRNGNSRTKFGQKTQKVQLIDHRRAYNCEIMLSKVKIPLHDMLTSVLALEDSALDIDQVENLIKFCPTKEEVEALKGYKGEKEKLGRCEQFMLELIQVPRIESKLRVFSYVIQFQSQISDLRNNLNIVNSVTDQIRGSSKLKGILQTILYLGNALNQGTARGSAAGFKLDSLLKLTDTRSWNKNMTLMHYLCKILADKMPELLDFSKDLSSLEPAVKIQLKYLAEEMQAISKGMEKVVKELSMSENDGLMSENFCKALKEFLSPAEGEVSSLAQLFSAVGKNVDSLIIYFGEDPARCPFEQVVSTLMSFQRMFNQALEDNRKQLEFERKKAEKEKQRTSASNKKT
ncbi:formin-like protein 18 isoform X1 [Lycium barbarum]|uniref:formin-like protein 18 isoform X1 n=1 Tax=Lycium barbarum TaxID=112863 RepID=UPI00293F3AE1|nr:formin-like protein 18 isoform X1 [Lycium barbarum]XP_060210119.1 formin-like protein 18 isoform X1 [Lycium barbarum]XP_060210120.1 formin-like protein 18 isoform X1 [Lycium barbarum]XP_060210121.1 formin-like protein 18 isoform X1 [Lycium barbarum]XP_060210123.1 formin-like protein 18 isoform X1 [Lycium barbarum]XP_060210124.1 formin-like protein 18 isoform X1 [Lycium barbarum]XP_060210125.1 formin-like protein 18 isoform X1 [Lycium barbarum]XP_060210126.1 formin-like protein 18 isoform 